MQRMWELSHLVPGPSSDIVQGTGSQLVTSPTSSHTNDKNQETKKSISTACQTDDWPTKQKILQPFVFSPGSDSVFYSNRGEESQHLATARGGLFPSQASQLSLLYPHIYSWLVNPYIS